MRLEPFLGHRQDKPLDRWPVHHTHSYSHSLQSPVHLSCMSQDCGRNPEENNINTERTYKLHRLLQQLGLQYCTYSTSLYYTDDAFFVIIASEFIYFYSFFTIAMTILSILLQFFSIANILLFNLVTFSKL